MRSMLQIMIAVSECAPATEEELRLCIACLDAKLHFARHGRDKFLEILKSDNPSSIPVRMRLQAAFAEQEKERDFNSDKRPMDEYLGPSNIPGSPEQKKRLAWAKGVYKKVTGEEI